MKVVRLCGVAVVAACLLSAAPREGAAAPITHGTIFLDSGIITASDPTAFTGITYVGTGDRVMFDRRTNSFVTYNAFLFAGAFADGSDVEIQVNPEFGTEDAAAIEALEYGAVIGRLPRALRTDLQTVWIHLGVQPFGGGNNNLLIHTGQAADYVAGGILEETLVHEASHTSLDAYHAASAGWLAAQAADDDFISTYARDNPTREDIAESFLTWLAVRHFTDRIDPALAAAIESTIPNRLQYFDRQDFNLSPLVVPEPATLTMLSLAGIAVLRRRRRERRPGTALR